ncbi:protein-export membrane protein, SecD/SecF family [Mycolicibacterium phlei]|uniref:Protein translocase subunit SecD n=3 Tax=Mycolicibacterium phlei TaxID=1771 RepID=A0A5N5VA38_MYCPH|nr:protein translocase subunit SecD [Mycolicibacterium phlei]VEG09936.1 protein-export membrane protein, SecD/SecF family [Mycobacteroides chelonae]AMO61829.1 Protein translocase subunit SecD [Mycolicibacterium phlei]EID11015.1 preprotein translocase subunit SecD [Mycolicibacterium phlei RIVM601174]KAB7758812.1 preprotein translocase subunit SecD [Mycolicibacterium phlei DSM 43239 = CCUG 21000]KXW67296.1 preprotein translocase subunit SecD [Mycolicibacterium phlei DSM 43239 = CCUG 21000]
MASSSPPVHPARYLSLFLVLLVGAYLLVFLTGDKKPEPKLGIDLQGGTRVTLTARTPDGSPPTRDALNQAQQIINDRVNGLGVSGSEVIIDGDNLVITVPGSETSEARNLGQTARLYIRPVLYTIPAANKEDLPPTEGPPDTPQGEPGAPPGGAPADPSAPQPPADAPESTDQQPGGQPQPRPYPQEPPAQPAPSPSPSPAPSPSPSGAPTPGTQTPPGPKNPQDVPLAQRIADEKQLRQSTDQQIQILALQFQATRCDQEDVLAGNDDPNLPLITCSDDGSAVYLLDKSILSGEQIDNATSGLDQQRGEWVVDLQFKSEGSKVWADFTAENVGTQTAFVLDSKVMSAPEIREAIPGGRTQITGQFTQSSARELANVLKYGSLPLSFESSEAETVSATLGLSSLRAGLIAGAVGLALVLLYSLLYYRVLGILTALSLVASGAMVYAILVLLGRWINYTLDLAGIAGLVIGIGMTADSFVVFFERIKDEIREGRSFRSAVPRGWARARKTIVSGNAVTLLAAVVLYILAVGQVKGFAFTLGLTTVLDVLVVFLVTWPLVYLASKSPTMAKPALNGLGAVQQIARERRAAAHTTGRD